MKPVNLINRVNNEKFICENIRETQFIDGVEYLRVRRAGEHRWFLMRKEVLEKVDTSTKRAYN